jgi:hypothetical protein
LAKIEVVVIDLPEVPDGAMRVISSRDGLRSACSDRAISAAVPVGPHFSVFWSASRSVPPASASWSAVQEVIRKSAANPSRGIGQSKAIFADCGDPHGAKSQGETSEASDVDFQ